MGSVPLQHSLAALLHSGARLWPALLLALQCCPLLSLTPITWPISTKPPAENILAESDLDWGQDLGRLREKLDALGVRELHMTYAGSIVPTDLLPNQRIEGLTPYVPVHGWVAVSIHALKIDSHLLASQAGRSDSPFGWQENVQPVAQAGKSILLWNIPPPVR